SARAPRLADQARVRGERLAKKPANRDARLNEERDLRAGSASMAANSFCMARPDGAPRLSLRSMVSAYSSRMTAYCRASSGSRASASSTFRESRAFSVPAACQGSSNSSSLGSCSNTFLPAAIMASLAQCPILSRVPPVFFVHRTTGSSQYSPECQQFLPLLPRTSHDSRRDRSSPDARLKACPGIYAMRHWYPSFEPSPQDCRTNPRSCRRPLHPTPRPFGGGVRKEP